MAEDIQSEAGPSRLTPSRWLSVPVQSLDTHLRETRAQETGGRGAPTSGLDVRRPFPMRRASDDGLTQSKLLYPLLVRRFTLFTLSDMEGEYELVTSTWPGEGVIVIYDIAEQRLATFTREFLRLGHVLNWAYIQRACQSMVQEAGTLHTDALTGQDSSQPLHPLDLETLPTAGRYWYIRSDQPNAACTWARGPRFRYARRGPRADGGQSSTMSHSSRSTARQSRFRTLLQIRDGRCIVTNNPDTDDAVAAHILPVSRPEYYQEVLGAQPWSLFHVSYGILLEFAWHHAFDRGDWALYPCPDSTDLIVHVFQGRSARKVYHGKRIPSSRFRVWDELEDLPDTRMLEFHYRQCLIKNMRGFQHFPP